MLTTCATDNWLPAFAVMTEEYGNEEQVRGGVTWLLFQVQRSGVNAITQPGGCRSIFKDMSEMSIAIGAHDLDTGHAVTGIGFSLDVCSDARSYEAGPATTGVEFIVRVK